MKNTYPHLSDCCNAPKVGRTGTNEITCSKCGNNADVTTITLSDKEFALEQYRKAALLIKYGMPVDVIIPSK